MCGISNVLCGHPQESLVSREAMLEPIFGSMGSQTGRNGDGGIGVATESQARDAFALSGLLSNAFERSRKDCYSH